MMKLGGEQTSVNVIFINLICEYNNKLSVDCHKYKWFKLLKILILIEYENKLVRQIKETVEDSKNDLRVNRLHFIWETRN